MNKKQYSLKFVIAAVVIAASLACFLTTIILFKRYYLNYDQKDPRCHPLFIARAGNKQCEEAQEQRMYLQVLQTVKF
jgi:hypothetical protein